MHAVTIAKYCDIEADTVVMDIAGLVVIDENTTLVGTFETTDEVMVATDIDEVIDILLDSKSYRLCSAVA